MGAAAPVVAVALFAAAALVVAGFSAVIHIRVGGVVRDSQTGLERHGAVLLLLALAGGGLALAALLGRRPALMLGVVAVGAAVLVVALGSDLPDLDRTGFFGQRYETAKAGAGPGFWLELAAAAGFLFAGLVGPRLLRTPPRAAPNGPGRPDVA